MRPQPAGVGQQHHPATGGSSRGPGRLPPDDRPPWQAPPCCPATHRLHQPLTRALSPLQTRRNASGAPSQATRRVRLAVPDCRRRSQTHLPELQLCPPHEWLPCSCPAPGFAEQSHILLAGVPLSGAGDLHGGDRPAATKADWRRHGRRRAAAHQPGRGHDGCVLEWPPRLGVVQAATELPGRWPARRTGPAKLSCAARLGSGGPEARTAARLARYFVAGPRLLHKAGSKGLVEAGKLLWQAALWCKQRAGRSSWAHPLCIASAPAAWVPNPPAQVPATARSASIRQRRGCLPVPGTVVAGSLWALPPQPSAAPPPSPTLPP